MLILPEKIMMREAEREKITKNKKANSHGESVIC